MGALVIAYILTEAVFLWSVKSASFIQVIVYATLFQLIAMALVGLSALLVPFLRPQFYRASATHRKFLGAPIVSIAGRVSIGTSAFIWYLYFHYAAFGLVKHGTFFAMIAVVIGAAILLYFGWLQSAGGRASIFDSPTPRFRQNEVTRL